MGAQLRQALFGLGKLTVATSMPSRMMPAAMIN
jgi:hypothetical protein